MFIFFWIFPVKYLYSSLLHQFEDKVNTKCYTVSGSLIVHRLNTTA